MPSDADIIAELEKRLADLASQLAAYKELLANNMASYQEKQATELAAYEAVNVADVTKVQNALNAMQTGDVGAMQAALDLLGGE